MKRTLHLFLFMLSMVFLSQPLTAQTISIDINSVDVGLYSGSGSDCGDCVSSPDPYIGVQFKTSNTATWGGTGQSNRNDVGCDSYGGVSGYSASGIPWSATTINIQIQGLESDGAVCLNDDGSCGMGAPSSGTLDNSIVIVSNASCGSNNGQYSSNRENCASDGSTNDYRARWYYRWWWDAGSITAATTAGAITAPVTEVCDGANTVAINNSSNGSLYPRGTVVFQQSINGGAWTDVGTATTNTTAAATAVTQTYTTGALAVVGGANTTYQFRRVARYCTDGSGGTTDYASNTVTINVVPDPNAPSATKVPNETSVCLGTTLSLTSPVKGSLPGQACSGFEYSVNGGAYGATATQTPATTGTYTIAVRVAGGCANGCNASAATTYTWTVVAQPTAPTSAVASPNTATNQCVGSTLTLSSGATGGNAGAGCSIEYQYSTDGGSTWTNNGTTIPSFAAVYPSGATKTNIIQARRSNCVSGCTTTAWATMATWTIIPDPDAPTSATASPSTANNQCVGTTLSLSTAATGGTNVGQGCFTEYQYSTDGGATWTGPSISIPSFGAVYPAGATKTNIIQARRGGCQTGCDNSAWATMATWTIVPDPTSPTTATASPAVASVCHGTTLTLTGAATGGNNGLSCAIEYRYSTDNGSTWSAASTTIPSFAAVGTSSLDNIIQVRRNSCQSGCDGPTTWNEIARWATAPDPDAPTTATASPADASVCDGTTLTLAGAATGGNQGVGCSIEYRYSTNGGTSWTTTGTTIPSFTAVATATNIIQARRASCQTGCDASSYNTVASWSVVAQPVAGTLTKTPNLAIVCQGGNVSAVLTAGSGGTGTTTDVLEYRTDAGSGFGAWTAYTSGGNIATTGLVAIEIQTYRTSSTSGCSTSSTNTVSWSVVAQPVSGTLTKSPDNTNVCEGTPVSATLTPGSGGTGTVTDVVEYRYNGTGTWTAYTSGANLSTTGKTQVEIRTYRTATGSNCSTGTTNTVSWIVDVAPVATATSKVFACDGTATLEATGISSGTTISWEYVSGPATPTGTTSTNPLTVTLTGTGTGVYNLLGTNTGCTDINLGTVNLVMPSTSTSTIATATSCGYCTVSDGASKYFYNSSGELIAKLDDDPLNTPAELGETEVCVRMDGSVQTVLDNMGNLQPYLPRQWTIHPANNTSTHVTLYFTNAELGALQAAASSTVYQFSGYSLFLTKYAGGQNGTFTPPCTGGTPGCGQVTAENVPAFYSAYGANHKLEFDVNTFSTFYVGPGLYPYSPLPVELVSFTGWNQGSVNKLQWITASERNTARFEIQKSTTPGVWSTIGEKSAAGNSNATLTYDFIDNNPVVGDNYYRLRVVDNDGTYSLSNMINIPLGEVVANSFTKIYPNPTGGKLNVDIQSTSAYNTKINVFDMLGKVLYEKPATLAKGLNTLQFDFSQLAKGSYILQFSDVDAKIHTTKFVKD